MIPGSVQKSKPNSTEVIDVYNAEYFLERVDGFDGFEQFDGTIQTTPYRTRRNIELLDIKRGEIFLDLGCGRGEAVIAAGLLGARVIGCDFSLPALQLAQGKLQEVQRQFVQPVSVSFVRCTATNLPITLNRFDKIMMSEFIEHISGEESRIVLKNILKCLKPGGTILVFTYANRWERRTYPLFRRYVRLVKGMNLPAKPPDTLSPDYSKLHLNEQSYPSLKKALREAGFVKIKVGFDVNPPNRAVSRLVWKLGAKYFFGTNLLATAARPIPPKG